MKRMLVKALSCLLAFNLVACGTILHPERKGQINGNLDPSIVVLDAIGLLFFFIPGVIAFAVDFTNGTIYLPGGKSVQLAPEQLDSVSDAQGHVNLRALEVAVRDTVSDSVEFAERGVRSIAVTTKEELDALLSGHAPAH